MRRKKKQTLTIIIIIIIIFFVLAYAYNFGNIKTNLSNLHIGGISQLDLVKNPQNYVGKEIQINNAFITTIIPSYEPSIENMLLKSKVITVREADGNWVNLPYKYSRQIYCSHVNLKGTIEENSFYYFNVTEAVCRD